MLHSSFYLPDPNLPDPLLYRPVRSNDAFDAQTGVDNSKPESVVNLTGQATVARLNFWLV
jgi:hypothetical protein